MNSAIKPVLHEWLMAVLWGVEKLMVPTLSNLVDSPEWPEDREQVRQHLYYLERRRLVQRERQAAGLVYRLTEQGRLVAKGGRDPEARWARPWDGKWRMMLFDLPTGRQAVRQRLLRWLRQNGFGFLQQSVWVRPDPLAELSDSLADYRDDVESLTIMEAQCCSGYADEAIVRGSWDFVEINKRYAGYLAGFGKHAPGLAAGRLGFARASQWLRAERIAWEHAFTLDPLLPRALLPPGYRGVKAWQARRRVLGALTGQLAGGR